MGFGTATGFMRPQGGASGFCPAQGAASGGEAANPHVADLNAGDNDRFSISVESEHQGLTSGWWRSIYFRADALGSFRRLAFFRPGTTGWGVYCSANTNVIVEAYDTGGSLRTAGQAGVYTTGTWYHVYAQFDGSQLGISIDNGSLSLSAAFGAAYAPPALASTGYVGSLSSTIHNFDGRLQNFRGGDGTLSASLRTELYGAGNPPSYAAASASLQAAASFWYDLDEESSGTSAVARADSTGNAASLTDDTNVPSILRAS